MAAALERSRITPDGRNEEAVVKDLEKDPEAKRVFFNLMWKWLEASEIEPIYVVKDGRRQRDYSTEAKLADIAQRKADKAATVLGRAYVTEKKEEIKPVPLPLSSEFDSSGWEDEPELVEEDQDADDIAE